MSTGKKSHKIFAIIMLVLIVGSTIGVFFTASYQLFDYFSSKNASETTSETTSETATE